MLKGDLKFKLTMRFGLGLLVYTIYGVLICSIGIMLFHHWIAGVLFSLLLFFTFSIFIEWNRDWKRFKSYLKWHRMEETEKEGIIKRRNHILEQAKAIMAS